MSAGEDVAKLLAKRAKLRRDHCARQIQRHARVWLARLRRQHAFVNKVCEPGGVYEQGRLRVIIAAWKDFAEDEKARWAKGVGFSGYRAGYLWQDGNRDMKERKFVVFDNHLDVVDANTGQTVWTIEFGQVRRVTKGVEHKKHDVTVELRTGHKDVYKLLNPIGFVAAFQFNMMKWVHREARRHERRKTVRHDEIFQESRASGEPNVEDFRPDPAPSLPTRAEREEASGADAADLPPALQLAFRSSLDKSGLFAPIQKPWKDDWIALRPEQRTRRQTYLDWKKLDPRVPAGSNRSHIYLVAIGDLEPFDGGCEIRHLADFASAFFHGLRVELLPPIPLRGLHRDRGLRLQMDLSGFDSEAACRDTSVAIQLPEIERYLRKLLPTNAFVLIGVTLHEICAGDGYTRGPAYATQPEVRERAARSRTCVLSLARLDPWHRRPREGARAAREARAAALLARGCRGLAQLGMLLLDADLCVFHACVMNGAARLEELALAPLHACPVCLRKLLAALGARTSARCLARYRALRRFCRLRGLAREEAWLARRLAALEAAHASTPTAAVQTLPPLAP